MSPGQRSLLEPTRQAQSISRLRSAGGVRRCGVRPHFFLAHDFLPLWLLAPVLILLACNDLQPAECSSG